MVIVNKEERRKQILNATKIEFMQNGFECTKIEQIAKRVGIGKSTVYEYFSSKEVLFTEMICEIIKNLNNALSEFLNLDMHIKQTLKELFDIKIDDNDNVTNDFLTLFNSVDVKTSKVALVFWKDYGESEREFVIDLLKRRIEKAVKLGEIKPSVDVALLAEIIFSTWMMSLDRKWNKKSIANNHYDDVVNMLFDGIGL